VLFFIPISHLVPLLEFNQYEGMDYDHWYVDHVFVLAPAATYIAQWLQSFREFPQRQKPGSFNLDRIMESITSGAAQNGSN
jgi:hypothetical protein